jgi:hypothetical protein
MAMGLYLEAVFERRAPWMAESRRAQLAKYRASHHSFVSYAIALHDSPFDCSVSLLFPGFMNEPGYLE